MELSFLHFLTVLVISIASIVILTVRYRLHAFFALIAACFMVGFGTLMPVSVIMETVKSGFGNILRSLGLLIITGTTLGLFLEKTGSARVMADFILKKTGKEKSPLALSITGFIVGLPVFCDSGYIVLSGLARSLARQTHIHMILLAGSLSTALYAVHCLLPPHPGMSAAAAQLDINFGILILTGLLFAIPAAATGYFWTLYSGKKLLAEEEVYEHASDETADEISDNLPSAVMAFLPVIVPIVLMMLRPLIQYLFPGSGSLWAHFLITLGDPVLALTMGIFVVLFSYKAGSSHHVIQEAIEKSGVILVIIGAGGSFGAIVAALNPAQFFETLQISGHLALLLFFCCAAVLKTAQGSSTVAIITTASLMYPLFPALEIISETEKIWAVLAMGAGSMAISLPNDSYFWVISRFSGLDTYPMLKVYSAGTFLMALVTLGLVMLASLLF